MPTTLSSTPDDNFHQYTSGNWWVSNYQMNRVAAAEEIFYPACNWSYDGGMLWMIEFIGGLNQKVNLTFSHQWSGPYAIDDEPLAKIQYL